MAIPAELFEYKQWVLWRRVDVNGRIAKLPISPWSGKAAACDRPETWSTYRHVGYARRKFRSDGIGFVFTSDDPFCGIDIDRCRTSIGEIAADAQALVHRFGSYTELSPSGSGIHILVKAKLPGPGRRSGNLEIYDSGRYFTITGRQLAESPCCSIEQRQEELDELIAGLFTRLEIPLEISGCSASQVSDDELIQRAKTAKNGERFGRLWDGDTSDFGGDHSRADLALCRMLAFWCKGDFERVDRLFRRSGLMREKWDRIAGGTRYGERTMLAISTKAD